MKNNKIFNRTFKVSLVAMALGLVNSAWAIDYKLLKVPYIRIRKELTLK